MKAYRNAADAIDICRRSREITAKIRLGLLSVTIPRGKPILATETSTAFGCTRHVVCLVV